MRYKLKIQNPGDPTSNLLFDEIVALVGDGEVVWLRMFFGFLTGSGMDALLGVPEVRDALLHSQVEVLVGLDAVTDRRGLERLLELAEQNPQFKPLVIRNATGALVHPKMLAARYADGRTVAVVGSNNLSFGGLRGNVEGYAIASFESEEHLDLSDWDGFIQRSGPLISEIDDEALEAAKQNERRLDRVRTAARRTRSRPDLGVVVSDGHVYETPVSEIEDLEEPVLVAQVPRAGNRWPQVHYSAKIIQDYFNVQANDHVRLREFNSTIDEEPQVVYSASNKNYKIELRAAREAQKAVREAQETAGEDGETDGYPSEGRPVVLFRREGGTPRRYRYVFLMPGDVGHSVMAALAEAAFQGPANHLPRAIVPRARMLAAWPGCPL